MDEFEKFYNRTLHFLSYRPRSEKEIKGFLEKIRANITISSKILQKLQQHKLIDDEKFAKWWVEQRMEFRPEGHWVLKTELRQKGISDEIIEKILGNEEIKILGDEGLKKLVEKKLQRYKGLPKQEIYKKLGDFLQRRGFRWEIIKKVIDEALEKEL